jgi:hypothetical protein
MTIKGEDMCMIAIMNSENMCTLFKVEYISFTRISVLEKVTMREMFSEYKNSALTFFLLRNLNSAI